jgi:ketosteroid isomerase-like protein
MRAGSLDTLLHNLLAEDRSPMRFWFASLALACAAIAASQPSLFPQAGPAFARLRAEWSRNLHDKKIDASVAAYTADGEFIQPNGDRVRGTKALRDLYQTITTTYDSSLTFNSLRTEVTGSLAYDTGTYRESLIVRASGKPQLSSGSYLTVYRRDPSGAWLIVEQVWTGSIQ